MGIRRVRYLHYLLASSFGLLVSGCAINNAQVPHATTYPATSQQKMQAGHHWNVLAGIEADNIISSLSGSTAPLVIERPAVNSSTFRKAYHDLLQSQLVRKGALLLDHDANNAARLSYEIQVLTHRDRGYLAPPMGTYTIAAGSVAFAGYAVSQTQPGWAVIPYMVGADLFTGSSASKEPTEVLVTTKITQDGRFLMSDSRIYYINNGDVGNYRDTPAGLTFEVVDR